MTGAREDDPFEVAIEHVAWSLNQGFSPGEVLASFNLPVPVGVVWRDVTWALATEQGHINEARSRPLSAAPKPRHIKGPTFVKGPTLAQLMGGR